MRQRLFRQSLVYAALLLLTVTVAQAAEPPDAATFYRQATIADVEGAIAMLELDHPGAAEQIHDDAFRASLAEAAATARSRAHRVTTAEGHQAVMSAFANALGDQHLSFRPTLSVARPSWVGLITAWRDGHWIVVDEDLRPGRVALRGATLVGCDGRGANEVARERLGGFRADWSIPAQRGQAAPWLLVDEGNPFLEPLKRCTFRDAGGTREIAMGWQPVARDAIIHRLRAATGIGAAGYGVRPVNEGWWVSINELTARAPAVIAEARIHSAQLRAAPFVVFDVRGNGGGASDIGAQLAAVLYGEDAVPKDEACPAAWRASAANLARLESYPAMLGDRLSPEANALIAREIDAMRAARDAGEGFSRPPRLCPREKALPQHNGPKVFLLTDRTCFSSCLLVTQLFRELGALHIGEATDGNTHYTENRREPLPSGLGTIGVQAAVDLSMPARVGPFEPDVAYGGDLTDTQAVERWVLSNAGRWTSLPRQAR